MSLDTARRFELGNQAEKARKLIIKQAKSAKKENPLAAGKAILDKVTQISEKKDDRFRPKFIELAMKL